MKIRTARLATAMIATALLAACSRDEPERPAGNIVEDTEVSVTPTPTPEAEPSPRIPAPDAAIQSNAIDELTDAAPAADEPPPAPDQQMLDDASATGMTARAARDAAPSDEQSDVVEEK